MTLTAATPVGFPPPALANLRPSTLRRRSLANVLREGHCAPSVTKTLLDAAGADAPWVVKLVAGLPGGIGNTGNECGGITAPLVVLGLRHARDPAEDGVPAVVSKARALLQDFQACHGSCACRDIQGRVPVRCVGVVRLAPERAVEIEGRDCRGAMSPAARQACALLHAHLAEQDFHCAHAVFRAALEPEPAEPALLDATSAFVGGTAYAGLTCSALAAGVMLLGLAHGESEQSPRRVLRAMAAMTLGIRAFAEDLEALNRTMDEGHALAAWFVKEFGTTRCRDLTGVDLSTLAGARRYVESGGVDRCREIARAVAARAREMTNGD